MKTFCETFFNNNSDYFKLESPYMNKYITYSCYSTSNLNSDDTEQRYFIIENDEILEVFENRFENVTTEKVTIKHLLLNIKFGFIFKIKDMY